MTNAVATTMELGATIDLILAEEDHLRRVARRLTRCAADADDLVQDALLRAYRARDRFEPGTSIRAWTTTILRRVFLTGAIRNKRRRLENDTDAGAPLDSRPGRSAGIECEQLPRMDVIAESLDEDLKKALDRVPETYRRPFYLAAIEDLTCAEIASILGVPEGTVMSRIHRARQRLKHDLAASAAAKATASETYPRLRAISRIAKTPIQPLRHQAAG